MDKFYFRYKYKKYKEKYINLKHGGTNDLNNIILIPHAGKKYSGDARLSAFKKIKNKVNQIFYIAAIHNMRYANTVFNDKIYIQNDNKNAFKNDLFLKKLNENQKKIINEEHSFRWVEKELNEYFNNPEITVIYPTEKSNLNLIVDSLKQYITSRNSLIIGTSDFIHYGENYGLNNWKNPHNEKILKEGEFIKNICDTKFDKVDNLHTKNHHLCCGYISIKTIMLISNYSKRKGEVVDYYDSYQSKFNDIRKYSLVNDIDQFVSYASIIFSNKNKFKLSELDIKLGLGSVRSIINYNINKKLLNLNESHFIPYFTYWWNMNNGIFVGTTFKGETNSSYGNYQLDNKLSATSLFNASSKCYEDSVNRWNKPITIDYELNKYKIEILDDKRKWNEIKATDLKSIHYNKGLHLTVTFNDVKYSATYLPGVWKEHFNDNPNEVLYSLTKKATNNKYSEWKTDKNATVKLYGSIKYLSDKII